MTDYKVIIDDTEFTIEPEELKSLDIRELNDHHYHILRDNSGFTLQLIDTDFLNKTLTLSVNGNSYQLKIEDAYDQMVNKMGLLANTAQKLNSIKAPMPGLILDIMVKPGDEIIEGTPLVVLSAMKMENMILSEGAGVVKSVEVEKDDAVDKGQLIIEME